MNTIILIFLYIVIYLFTLKSEIPALSIRHSINLKCKNKNFVAM